MSDQQQKTDEQRNQEAAAKAAEYRAKFEHSDDKQDPITRDETPPPAERPDYIPEKFWNAETGEADLEGLAKAHRELEQKFHADHRDDPKEETASGDDNEQGSRDEPRGLMELDSVKKAQDEFAANQELSDETIAALEKDGISRSMVDAYIEGRRSQASQFERAAYEGAGSAENYNAMIEWASQNLNDAEARAFNVQIESGDPEVVKAAAASLYQRYAQDANMDGDAVGGRGGSARSTVFESRAEMAAAINKVDPTTGKRLYDVDSGYRAEVMRKIGNTRRAGINI